MKILFDNEEEKTKFFKIFRGCSCPSVLGFKNFEYCFENDNTCEQCWEQACEWEVVVNN